MERTARRCVLDLFGITLALQALNAVVTLLGAPLAGVLAMAA